MAEIMVQDSRGGVYVLPKDYDEGEFEVSEEQIVFEQFANEAKDNEQYSKMTVSRVPMNRHGQRGAQKLSFLFEAALDEYSYSQLLSKLRDEYGSGFYKIQARNEKGQLKLNKTVAVEAPAEDTDKASADNGSGVIAQVSQTLADQQTEMRELLRDNFSRPQNDPIDTIVKVAGAVAPILTALGISRPEAAPAPKTLVDQLTEFKMLQELFGGDGSDGIGGDANLYSLLTATVNSFGGPIAAAIAAGAQSGELNTQGVAALPAPKPTEIEKVTDQQKHDMEMRKQIHILIQNAKTGIPPEHFAGILVNYTPEDKQDELWDFISAEKCVDTIIELEPAAEPYREWFVALRLAVIDLMADTEKDLQDEPGESSLPESDAVAGVDTETPTSDSTSDSDTPINP